jgi:transcriptional regulator with XRE-family HTH domain
MVASTSPDSPGGDGASVALDERELAATIGSNLRRLRTRQGLTLEALARLSSVSKSMLGEIELAHTTPNISLLWRIGNALGVQVSVFLQKETPPPVQLFRLSDGGGVEAGEVSLRPLSQGTLQGRVRFHELRLHAGGEEVGTARPAGVTVNLAVAVGELDLLVGEDSYRLAGGDAAHFSASQPHTIRNPGAVSAVAYLLTIYPVNLSFG